MIADYKSDAEVPCRKDHPINTIPAMIMLPATNGSDSPKSLNILNCSPTIGRMKAPIPKIRNHVPH
jgi:hypothetical protein